MNSSKKKKQHKISYQYCIWYGLLIYVIVVQFIIVGFMGYVGNRFILGEYIPSEEVLLDASIMIGVMVSVLLVGVIRRRIIRNADEKFIDMKRTEQYCIVIISILVMFIIEWVVAGVNLMLLPVWILLRKVTDWQNEMEKRKNEQQNQLMKTYVKEHIEQLPAVHLGGIGSLEKKRFLLVLEQNKESLGSRVLQGILSLGRRLANGFVFLVMGSLLCLLIYEGDMEIWEALLYLFSLNTLISAMNVLTQIQSKKEKV